MEGILGSEVSGIWHLLRFPLRLLLFPPGFSYGIIVDAVFLSPGIAVFSYGLNHGSLPPKFLVLDVIFDCKSSFFSKICMQCYNFVCKYCFCYTPQIWRFLWLMCCLILKYLGDIPAIFLVWISSLSPLWSESIQCMLSVLFSLLRCFMAQNVVCVGECCMWNVYFAAVVICPYPSYPVDWV